LFLVQTLWQTLSVGADLYLSLWTQQSAERQAARVSVNLAVYAGLALGGGLTVLVRALLVCAAGFRAARSLFERVLTALLAAPMAWFDRNPSGPSPLTPRPPCPADG
jgi:ABC-type multidrug transport system fused ATPase/permease subunit